VPPGAIFSDKLKNIFVVAGEEPTRIRVRILEVAGSGSKHLQPNLLTGLPTSTPNKLYRRLDVWVKALFHWTGVRCIFEPLLILRARCPGNSNRDSQAIDFSRGSAGHFLFNCRRGSVEVNIQSSGNDAHSGQHARSE
jgi:hypothetical protein